MLSINAQPVFQKFVLILVVAGLGLWAQGPTAKTISAKTAPPTLLEMAQAGPSLDVFDFALLTGSVPGFTAAVDAALGSAATEGAQDRFLTDLANLIAGLTRQGATPQGTLDCNHMSLLMTALANRAGSVQTASAISALSASVATALPCESEPVPAPPEECFGSIELPLTGQVAILLAGSISSCLF